ncbi:MAG: dihydrodipicolinate synthase family protein [Nitrososphaerota archaeon]|nr:dihydrodipicolinate synthase family protein [Nitrososphaerota archaeon]
MEGVFYVMPTPFDGAQQIDRPGISSLVEFAIRSSAAGIVILGVTGEASKLSDPEKLEVVGQVVKDVRRRTPVVVGVGNPSEEVAAWLGSEIKKLGGDALMVLPPKMTDEDALARYYGTVSDSAGLPIVVQDEPATSGTFLSVSAIERICRRLGDAPSLKLEDPPTPRKIRRIRERVGRSPKIFGGIGGQYFLYELESGGDGIMTGFAYPEILVKIYRLYRDGDRAEAADVFFRSLPLIQYEAQPQAGLAIRKYALHRRGVLPNPSLRKPAVELDEQDRALFETVLKRTAGQLPWLTP